LATQNATPVVITGSAAQLVGSTSSTPPIALMMSGTGANNGGGTGKEMGQNYQGNAQRVDGFASDLSQDGYALNGTFAATLAASTPITVDITAAGTAQGSATAFSQAGDSLTALLNRVYINNFGSAPVTIEVGASHPLTGVPTFVIPAGTKQRLDFGAAGITVAAGATCTIKFDPSTGTPSFAVAYGGS
jgi:hypothetical protein